MGVEPSAGTRTPCVLIQFARAPQEGEVKTRLIPHLGAAGACALHCELTRWTCAQLLASALGDVELFVTQNPGHPLFADCLEQGVARIVLQSGVSLGERMHHALSAGLARSECAILVGSDCPGINADYLASAAAALRDHDVVIGPAMDGGYVLIGARRIVGSIFRGIRWGSADVYAQTAAALTRAALRWTALHALADIDTPADLPVWYSLRGGIAAGERPAQDPTPGAPLRTGDLQAGH